MDTKINNDDLKHIEAFTKLEALFLSGTSVNDEDLIHLKDLSKLKELALSRTQVSSKGFTYLKDLSSLNRLTLFKIDVRDIDGKNFHAYRKNNHWPKVVIISS